MKWPEFIKGQTAAQLIAVLVSGLIIALVVFLGIGEIGFENNNDTDNNIPADISGISSGTPTGDLTGLAFRAGDYEINADASQLVQEIKVPYEADLISVTPQVKDGKKTTLAWSVNNSVFILIQPRVTSPFLPLKTGSNTVKIRVRTNEKIVDMYTVTVVRENKGQ